MKKPTLYKKQEMENPLIKSKNIKLRWTTSNHILEEIMHKGCGEVKLAMNVPQRAPGGRKQDSQDEEDRLLEVREDVIFSCTCWPGERSS